MGNLGSFFPDDAQQQFVASNMLPGKVLWLDCEFTTPPKPKYLVLVHTGDPVLCFLINSRISAFINHRPAMKACQIKITPQDCGCLDHDSFIDCSNVRYFPAAEVRQQLLADLTRVRGKVSASTEAQIIQVVQRAQTISPKHKRLIVAALRQS